MATAIPGSPILVTLTASSISTTIYADDVSYSIETRKFQRKEFSNTFLATLAESDGSEPVTIKNATNKTIQINFSCGNYTPRDYTPDDANLSQILQRMIVKTYSIKGGPTAPSSIDQLFNISLDHEKRYDRFDAYLDALSQKISVGLATSFQNDNFTYLTSTGLTLTGALMDGGSETNCLIRKFSWGQMYEDVKNQTMKCKDWSATIEIIEFINSPILY